MIDVHIHPLQVSELLAEEPGLGEAVREVFGLYVAPQPFTTLQGQLSAAGIDHAVLLPLDCTARHGCCLGSNEGVARLAARDARLIPFGSVDPNDPRAARRLREDIVRLGLRGLKLDPGLQGFAPADRERAYPVYAAAQDLGLPVLMHTGMSWAPHSRLSAARPLDLEPVAADFPQLRLILAHMGWPWVLDAAALALKYEHVYLDTAAVYAASPRESLRFLFGVQLPLAFADRNLRTKILFGSNYPRVDPGKVLAAVRELPLSSDTLDLILHGNAARLLGLPGERRGGAA